MFHSHQITEAQEFAVISRIFFFDQYFYNCFELFCFNKIACQHFACRLDKFDYRAWIHAFPTTNYINIMPIIARNKII